MGKSVKDDDLKKMLDHPDIPELDDATRDRIVTMAVNRFRETGQRSEAAPKRPMSQWLIPALKPAMAAAACLVLIVMVRNEFTVSPDDRTAAESAQMMDSYNVAVFQEYQTLFQNELRAVVARDGEVDVMLGGQDDGQINPVVFVHLEMDGEPVFITAYSGQSIETVIAGKNVTLEILTTSDSDVVLVSDNFMVDDGVLHGAEGIYADAHVLEMNL